MGIDGSYAMTPETRDMLERELALAIYNSMLNYVELCACHDRQGHRRATSTLDEASTANYTTSSSNFVRPHRGAPRYGTDSQSRNDRDF